MGLAAACTSPEPSNPSVTANHLKNQINSVADRSKTVGPLPVVPRNGYLDVEVPRTVSLDGVVQGFLPTTVDVPVGRHDIEVKLGTQSLIRKSLDVDVPTQVPVTLPLATITVDHAPFGSAPLTGMPFQPGVHVVDVDVEGAGRAEHTVTVVEGSLTGLVFEWHNGHVVGRDSFRPLPPNPYAPAKPAPGQQ